MFINNKNWNKTIKHVLIMTNQGFFNFKFVGSHFD